MIIIEKRGEQSYVQLKAQYNIGAEMQNRLNLRLLLTNR